MVGTLKCQPGQWHGRALKSKVGFGVLFKEPFGGVKPSMANIGLIVGIYKQLMQEGSYTADHILTASDLIL